MNDKQQLAAMGAEMAEQQHQPLCMAKCIEQLEAQVRALTLPEGWQLVPAKPTPAMRDAMRNGSRKDWPSDELCNVRYIAMLAAAPKPEAK